MDDTDDEDAGYPPEPRHLKPRPALSSSTRPNPPRIGRHSADLARDDEEEQQKRKQNYADRPSDDEDDDVGGRDGDSSGEDVDSSSDNREKRRRIDKFALGFELAPHVSAPPVAPSKPPTRILPTEWSEELTFVLLDSWGDRYMQNGRKSLRPDQWSEVHKKVLQSSRVHRTDSQCRNRIDTLKKKYRKEKAILTADGKSGSKWVYFKKMDALMSLPSSSLLSSGKQPLPPPQPKLPYGVDAGENVFGSSYVHRDSCDGNSAMRDCVSEDDSDGFPPKRENLSGSSDSSFRMLAESIRKFGEIYEKMESNKRQQISEIERMRKEIQRDLEVQKRQILERAQLEIAKLSEEHGDGNDEEQEDEDDNSGSTENLGGFISASLFLTAFV
ncbi:trihelix transcription factor ASIL2-like [Zingiber officinale]|uniref:trihelix transcription factor ASIL2-like n=1 Tax=Zingiber officinale TaxID=94328 RepID=UPI001C4B19E4|nr:trihelix transcription factor ASIL2-like [Zingiber officinale]